MKTENITVKMRDGAMGAYLAIPDQTPAGAIIAIMEIWGVNDTMRHHADEFADAGYLCLVPDLFWPEFGNILWKATRQGRISQRSAEDAIAALEKPGIPTTSGLPLLREAYLLAAAFERTVYDSIYVTLAVLSAAPLITADERLANALASRFPVRWLGSL